MKRIALLLIALLASARASAGEEASYLAFQFFLNSDSPEIRRTIPQPSVSLDEAVNRLVRTIGTTGSQNRRLAFVVGPISFDDADDTVRDLIRHTFQLALQKDIAVGFHIDDSMFWGRLQNLKVPQNLERASWGGDVNTGRRLDWSSTPLKIMPQLCLNSQAVLAEAKRRATLIGLEIKSGAKLLSEAGKEHLLLGVILGWETQIGRDFETGKALGYCAVANQGYSPAKPPQDIDVAREAIVQQYIDYWATALVQAGAPERRIYSHVAFMSRTMFDIAKRSDPQKFPGTYSETVNFSPPSVAFGKAHYPGFSTYPQAGHLGQLQEALQRRGNPPWASSEGTAIDPAQAEIGGSAINMEGYLGNLYNHGARVVNLFGWGVGELDNPFRRVAESPEALAAYRKFLAGEPLVETPVPMPRVPSLTLEKKMRRIQRELPTYVAKHGDSQAAPLATSLENNLKRKEFEKAETNADQLLRLLDSGR